MFRKLLNIILVILLLVAGAITISSTWNTVRTYISPRNDYTLDTTDVISYSPIVRANGYLHIERQIVNENKGCVIHAYRILAPEGNLNNEIILNEHIRNSVANNNTILSYEVHVPKFIAPGKYVFYSRVEYYCTFIQRLFNAPIHYSNTPVKVEVLPAL